LCACCRSAAQYNVLAPHCLHVLANLIGALGRLAHLELQLLDVLVVGCQ
jgi:hypothetical protein